MEKRTRSYLQLAKPGITISNTMTAIAGFFLASSRFGFDVVTLAGVIIGVAAIIASACVVNNVLDRDIDRRMKRTAGRELVVGTIKPRGALVFATVLAAIGFFSLGYTTNWLTVLLGIIAFVWYVAIYGVAKRTTAYSTIIGGVAGSLPPVAGYVAVSGQIDAVAMVLFLLLQIWQMPHFYAIALFRADEYRQAKLPVWSVRYGLRATKQQILFYIGLFLVISPLLGLLGSIGVIGTLLLVAAGLYWLVRALQTYRQKTDVVWARSMFGISLLVLLLSSVVIATGGYLP